jgi:hypothetical protein
MTAELFPNLQVTVLDGSGTKRDLKDFCVGKAYVRGDTIVSLFSQKKMLQVCFHTAFAEENLLYELLPWGTPQPPCE